MPRTNILLLQYGRLKPYTNWDSGISVNLESKRQQSKKVNQNEIMILNLFWYIGLTLWQLLKFFR